jgi:DNA-directed RNA polymerase specialized sigma24 family protein
MRIAYGAYCVVPMQRGQAALVPSPTKCVGGGTMNGRNNLLHELTPSQRFAVQIALHRFAARYRCPCPDAHEWRADCEAVAVVAVLTADEANPTEPSPLEISPEESACTLGAEVSLRQMWEQWDEPERQRVLWLARQAENALKRFWRQERRYYSHADALVVLDEEGEWVEREVEDSKSLEAVKVVIQRVDDEQLLSELQRQLDWRSWRLVEGLLAGVSQVEIARELGLSASAVNQRLRTIARKAAQIRQTTEGKP